ncbi:uncharacterized protein RHO25_003801 [Cercospora beticola]|uniref:Heterokaryon incompatibility domain-containing protein n=1 Tax=Cercospora beticola TaxID=122368 RepID=A0ABZ0NI56_CERBT|nr:hypothetical protein RHO25_003801 [Cercospora beticola]
MMFDVYTLAQDVIVWLGEGTFPEGDQVAWQLTRCLEDAEERVRQKKPNEYFRPREKLRIEAIDREQLQIEAIDTFEKIEICEPRPSIILKPNSAAVAQHAFQADPVDYPLKATFPSKDNLETWLAADSQRLRRLVVKFAMFLPLLQRKYWKRRWILQENFSRMRCPHSRLFYWGKYSTDWKTLSTALWVAAKVIYVVQSRKAKHRSPNALESFRSLVTNAKRILDPDELSSRDLLWCVTHFSDFHCADPRDRLYSLLPLVSGHGLRADYTATFEIVCTRFTKSMVDRGDMRVLCLAGIANHSPSTAVPS